MFSGNHHGDDGGDISASGKEAKEIEAGQRHGNAAASAFEAPQRDTNNSAGQATSDPIDLLTLLPDNFSEIPYIA